MAVIMEEKQWQTLLCSICAGRCTPLLGAGVGGFSAAAVARDWAAEYHYPLRDRGNLARVSQYVAITHGDDLAPKRKLSELLRRVAHPSSAANGRLLGVLARMPLGIYLTTNYDTLLERALRREDRQPTPAVYRWSARLASKPSVLDTGYEPSVAQPIVFHLYGHAEDPDTMVLTEDDYLEFVVGASCESPLPPIIQQALASTSLLLAGYSFDDPHLPVLLRTVSTFLRYSLVPNALGWFVQAPLRSTGRRMDHKARARQYCETMLSRPGMHACWASTATFARELESRWRKYVAQQ